MTEKEEIKRKNIPLSEERLNKIDYYRRNTKEIPNETDAILELFDLGYEAWKKSLGRPE